MVGITGWPRLVGSPERPGKRASSALGLVLALALGTASCGSDSGGDGGANASEPIKIGYLVSATGCGEFAQDQLAGAQLAVDDLNAAGGLLGRPLKLEVRDDQYTPNVGVQQARDLVLNEHVKYLAGTCSSAVAQAVRQTVVDPAKAFYVAGVTDPSVFENVGDGNSNMFGTLAPGQLEGVAIAQFVKSLPDVKTVAFIGDDYSNPRSVFDAFKQELEGSGIEIVMEDFVAIGTSDYSPYINKILSLKPDFLYNFVAVDGLVTFSKQAKSLGLYDEMGPKSSTSFWDLSTLIAAGSAAPAGQYGETSLPEPYLFPSEEMDAVTDAFTQSTGRVATGAVVDGYNQITMIAQGIERAGVDDPSKAAAKIAGSEVQFLQGGIQIRSCDHLPVVDTQVGVVTAPKGEFDFPHLADVSPVSVEQTPC